MKNSNEHQNKFQHFLQIILTNKLLIVIFGCLLFKQILFTALVPLWHTPDEQAHFAQEAYFAEFGQMPKVGDDLNQEILISETLLGTDRDKQGNNKFTHNPTYRIEYIDNLNGKYENRINNIPQTDRKVLIKQEASNYPPLYYWIASIPYKLYYSNGLIDRVFASRIVSIILAMGTYLIAWLIAKRLFKDNFLYQLTYLILVSFQPMLSFVFAGVTSDNLMNFLFSLFIYLSIKILQDKLSIILIFETIVTIVLLYLTKPQFILAIPILILAFLMKMSLSVKLKLRIKLFWFGFMGVIFLTTGILIATPWADNILRHIPLVYTFHPGFLTEKNYDFIFYLRQTLYHTEHEVLPWYWGVFDWLSVVYPIDVIRVINRVMLVCGIGLIVQLLRASYALKQKSFLKLYRQNQVYLFLIISTVIYISGITYYNYLFILGHGFPFGIQGRYYFPLISGEMAILLIGLLSIVPNIFPKLKSIWVRLIGLSMIGLNIYAIYLVANTYYDLSSINSFIIQASQYKPSIFKGDNLTYLVGINIIFLVVVVYKYLKLNLPKID